MMHRERYFTERLFWMPDSNELLHVFFVHGRGWFAVEEWTRFAVFQTTYSELMRRYTHRQPELLLQEEL